eukprot:1138295-Pelagomonas_calceolata.AAC.1
MQQNFLVKGIHGASTLAKRCTNFLQRQHKKLQEQQKIALHLLPEFAISCKQEQKRKGVR